MPAYQLVLFFETAPLLRWIAQLGKAIGDLNAADIELKPFRNRWVIRFCFRQRTAGSRVVHEKKRATGTQLRFDITAEYLFETALLQRFFWGNTAVAPKGIGHGATGPGILVAAKIVPQEKRSGGGGGRACP